MHKNIFTPQDLLSHTLLPSKAMLNPSCHIAVIVKKNKILGIGTNKLGSRSSGSGFSKHTIHAEIQAIKSLGNLRRLHGSTMFVFRQSRTGLPLNSQPCKECSSILTMCMQRWGLSKVYYSC